MSDEREKFVAQKATVTTVRIINSLGVARCLFLFFIRCTIYTTLLVYLRARRLMLVV